MGRNITTGVYIAAIFAVLVALIAFPPAGIVVGVAVVWWMISTEMDSSRESRDRFAREEAERRAAADRREAGED